MAATIDITVSKAENLDTSRAQEGAKIFCFLQKSGSCFGEETRDLEPAPSLEWNQKFTFQIDDPLIDSILISVFASNGTQRYKTAIGSVKIPASLAQNSGTSKPFDIYSYADPTFTGTLYLTIGDQNSSTPKAELPSEELISFSSLESAELSGSDSSFLSGGSEDMGSDSSVRRRRRKPAEFVPVQGRDRWQDLDVNALMQRDRKKHRRRKVEGGELKEVGDGSTLDKMMIQKKDRNLNAALERLKMDPVKMKAFADYSAVMEKNKKLVKAALTEGRWTKSGSLNKPLSEVTLRSIRFAIEETKEWIEKVSKLEVSKGSLSDSGMDSASSHG